MADRLTAKQALFVQHYIATDNGTQSAIAAGYAAKSAHVTASKLLRLPKVAKAVDAAREKSVARVKEKLSVTEEQVIRGLLAIALGKDTPPNVKRQAWVDLGRHLGMFVQRFSFTAEQLDRAAASVADDYGLEGYENEIADEAGRILKQAERDAR